MELAASCGYELDGHKPWPLANIGIRTPVFVFNKFHYVGFIVPVHGFTNQRFKVDLKSNPYITNVATSAHHVIRKE